MDMYYEAGMWIYEAAWTCIRQQALGKIREHKHKTCNMQQARRYIRLHPDQTYIKQGA